MLHNNHRFLIILLSFLLFSNVTFAQNTAEISQLKVKIFELEKRLDKLERMIEKSPSNQLQHSEKWKILALWRRMRTGMSRKQVAFLLGEPARKGRSGFGYWYYEPYANRNAYVRFSSDSVYDWVEPD